MRFSRHSGGAFLSALALLMFVTFAAPASFAAPMQRIPGEACPVARD